MRAFIFLLTAAFASAQSAARLKGRVVDQSGVPVPKTTVQLSQKDPSSARPRSVYIEVSDSNGKFSFDSIPVADFDLSAKRPGYLPPENPTRVTLTAGTATTEVQIIMGRLGFISGRVTDEDGDPVFHARVQVVRIVHLNGIQQRITDDSRFLTDSLGNFY